MKEQTHLVDDDLERIRGEHLKDAQKGSGRDAIQWVPMQLLHRLIREIPAENVDEQRQVVNGLFALLGKGDIRMNEIQGQRGPAILRLVAAKSPETISTPVQGGEQTLGR